MVEVVLRHEQGKPGEIYKHLQFTFFLPRGGVLQRGGVTSLPC